MDIIEKINGSVIQHGPHNNRIYIMRMKTEDTRLLIDALDSMALKNGYSKIFAKIPSPEWPAFSTAGYLKEAVVPRFFKGKIDCFFVSKYFSCKKRQTNSNRKIMETVKQTGKESVGKHLEGNVGEGDIISCTLADTVEMGELYKQVFESYPFPIQNPAYLEHLMQEGVLYFGIRIKDRIAALSAAEIDMQNQHAEMTDFATLPAWRGKGFAHRLLNHMDRKMRQIGIKTTYTIARATSAGMNAVFKNRGYHYAGILLINSQICGSIQDMAVWYKFSSPVHRRLYG